MAAAPVDPLRSDAASAALKARLEHYPPFTPPFPGWGPRFALPKAQANLEHLLGEKPARLRMVGELLSGFGLDIRDALETPDPRPFLDGLWRWVRAAWPGVERTWGLGQAWRDSRRDGPHIMLSLLGDVALLLGEMVLVRRPDYAWVLDEAPEDRVMACWRQPELILPAPRPELEPPRIDFDVFGVVVGRFEQIDDFMIGMKNDFLDLVSDAVLGGGEQLWRPGPGGEIAGAPGWDEWLAGRS